MTGLARTLAVHGTYPAMLVGATALGVAMLDAGYTPAVAVAVLGFACLAAAGLLERAIPQTPAWALEPGEFRADLLHAALSNPLPTELFRWLFLSGLVALSGWASEALGTGLWPADWPLLAQLVLALLTADFASYAVHRGFHASRLFPLHAVHHCSPRMYFMLAARKHPIASFIAYGGRFSVLWFLGAPDEAIALYTILTAANSAMQHGNLALRTGPLRHVFVTPELHRVHHSKMDGELDCNFGDVLTLWDQLFGSLRVPERGRSDAGRIGLPDREVPATFRAHLQLPFHWNGERAN